MTVVSVVDGDTVEVRFADGDVADVRLLGVDTPEVYVETDPAEWEGIPLSLAGRRYLRTWGHKASAFTSRWLEAGERIRVAGDPQADRRGAYGRLLVYVYDDSSLFNLVLIKRGYARFYETTFSKRARFAHAEQQAQAADVGVWNFSASTPTETGNDTAVSLAVVAVRADAAGNDHENTNDEYIVLQNTGEQSLNLGGWQVTDEAGHTYRFPSGFSLAAGATVTLHTGSGDDTGADLYWESDSAIWNNGGDTVYVYNSSGGLVIEYSYT